MDKPPVGGTDKPRMNSADTLWMGSTTWLFFFFAHWLPQLLAKLHCSWVNGSGSILAIFGVKLRIAVVVHAVSLFSQLLFNALIGYLVRTCVTRDNTPPKLTIVIREIFVSKNIRMQNFRV